MIKIIIIIGIIRAKECTYYYYADNEKILFRIFLVTVLYKYFGTYKY